MSMIHHHHHHVIDNHCLNHVVCVITAISRTSGIKVIFLKNLLGHSKSTKFCRTGYISYVQKHNDFRVTAILIKLGRIIYILFRTVMLTIIQHKFDNTHYKNISWNKIIRKVIKNTFNIYLY